MHRLTKLAGLGLLAALALTSGCGGSEKKAKHPETGKTESSDGATKESTSPGKANSAGEGGDTSDKKKPKDSCGGGASVGNLEELLTKSDCEVPDQKPETIQNPEVKGKLEVTVTASPTKVAPGGKTDLLVTFANKTKEPMPIHFRIDPLPRFETETYDAKKKRADMPAGQPPPPPKGHSAPPPADAKIAKVVLGPNGSATVRVPWEAVKMKWAPDKVRGTAIEKGYPRSSAGPLPKGKYTVKVVTPLVGVFEGGEHEVSAPKVDIEVGG